MTVDKMALEQRRNDIRDLIMVPGEKVNIDMLMDVLGTGSINNYGVPSNYLDMVDA